MKDKHASDGGSTTYYDIPVNTKDIQDLIEYRSMNFSMGNIFKACWRIGKKEGIDDIYDLNKIIFFAEREKNRILKNKNKYECQDNQSEVVEETAWIKNIGIAPTGAYPSKIEIKLVNGAIYKSPCRPDWRILGYKTDILEWRYLKDE